MMSPEEGVEKILEIKEQVSTDIMKPGLSHSFIAGSMVMGGAAVMFRGITYLISYIKAEKDFTTSVQ